MEISAEWIRENAEVLARFMSAAQQASQQQRLAETQDGYCVMNPIGAERVNSVDSSSSVSPILEQIEHLVDWINAEENLTPDHDSKYQECATDLAHRLRESYENHHRQLRENIEAIKSVPEEEPFEEDLEQPQRRGCYDQGIPEYAVPRVAPSPGEFAPEYVTPRAPQLCECAECQGLASQNRQYRAPEATPVATKEEPRPFRYAETQAQVRNSYSNSTVQSTPPSREEMEEDEVIDVTSVTTPAWTMRTRWPSHNSGDAPILNTCSYSPVRPISSTTERMDEMDEMDVNDVAPEPEEREEIPYANPVYPPRVYLPPPYYYNDIHLYQQRWNSAFFETTPPYTEGSTPVHYTSTPNPATSPAPSSCFWSCWRVAATVTEEPTRSVEYIQPYGYP